MEAKLKETQGVPVTTPTPTTRETYLSPGHLVQVMFINRYWRRGQDLLKQEQADRNLLGQIRDALSIQGWRATYNGLSATYQADYAMLERLNEVAEEIMMALDSHFPMKPWMYNVAAVTVLEPIERGMGLTTPYTNGVKVERILWAKESPYVPYWYITAGNARWDRKEGFWVVPYKSVPDEHFKDLQFGTVDEAYDYAIALLPQWKQEEDERRAKLVRINEESDGESSTD